MKFTLCIPCLFGLEAMVADELKFAGFTDVRSENGRVFFKGGYEEIARANLIVRCGERVLILLSEFNAMDFDSLFEGVKRINLAEILPSDACFPVTGHCLNSKLMSVPACQSIIKKAAVESLKKAYGEISLPEDGALYKIRFSIIKDVVSIYLDTSGDPLFKRGYRTESNIAPIRETLAAGLVKISRIKHGELLFDPFCGSGTIVIEAAMRALNIAPGLNRNFTFMTWRDFNPEIIKSLKSDLEKAIKPLEQRFFGTDLDGGAVEIARKNAMRAGVGDSTGFKQLDVSRFYTKQQNGVIITNPPYGERMGDIEQARVIYKTMGAVFERLEGFRKYIITNDKDFEIYYGKRATKKRKLYNGMLECNLYQYF